MSFNYGRSADTSIKLLSKFGRDITHNKVSNSAYDVNTGAVTNSTVQTTVKAADFAVKGNFYIAETLIQSTDRYALVAPTVSDISVTDTLIIDGATWSIIAVQKLSPAGTVVLFKCYIRK